MTDPESSGVEGGDTPEIKLARFPVRLLIPAISPEMDRDVSHLSEWMGLLDRAAEGEPVRGMDCEPIRHFKTTATNHGVIKILLKDPSTPVIHLSHSHDKATLEGKKIRQLAQSCDQQFGTSIGPVRGFDQIHDWRNSHGGGVVTMSASQSRLGYDCGALIVDDPLDEMGAIDALVRQAVDDAISHYTARTMRRGRPGPVLIVMSRWHPDDPVGRRLLRTEIKWEYVQHEAIVDLDGERERAFAPHVWSLEELKKVRAELREVDPTERYFWAQFQNDPRPPGTDLFRDPTYYEDFPSWPYRIIHGADLAFTQGKHSDFFAMVTM
jgi:hypothetical protein